MMWNIQEVLFALLSLSFTSRYDLSDLLYACFGFRFTTDPQLCGQAVGISNGRFPLVQIWRTYCTGNRHNLGGSSVVWGAAETRRECQLCTCRKRCV